MAVNGIDLLLIVQALITSRLSTIDRKDLKDSLASLSLLLLSLCSGRALRVEYRITTCIKLSRRNGGIS